MLFDTFTTGEKNIDENVQVAQLTRESKSELDKINSFYVEFSYDCFLISQILKKLGENDENESKYVIGDILRLWLRF